MKPARTTECPAYRLPELSEPLAPTALDADLVESLFPDLQVLRQLGEDQNWLVKQRSLERLAVLKLIRATDREAVVEFKQEAQLLASQGSATLYESGELGGICYRLTEYGSTLENLQPRIATPQRKLIRFLGFSSVLVLLVIALASWFSKSEQFLKAWSNLEVGSSSASILDQSPGESVGHVSKASKSKAAGIASSEPVPGSVQSENNAQPDEMQILTKALTNISDLSVKVEDPKGLLAGNILSNASKVESNAQGLLVETLFMVHGDVLNLLRYEDSWDPSKDPKRTFVFGYGDSPYPTIQQLKRLSYASPMQSLVYQTSLLPGNPLRLNLSNDEAKSYVPEIGNGQILPPTVERFWKDVLRQRSDALLRQSDEMELRRRALNEASAQKIYDQKYEWNGIVVSPAKELVSPHTLYSLKPDKNSRLGYTFGSQYWKFVNVVDLRKHDGSQLGAFILGSRYGTRERSFDIQYYVSNGYFARSTLREAFPIKTTDRGSLLIRRRDYFVLATYDKPWEDVQTLYKKRVQSEIEAFRDYLESKKMQPSR